MDNHPVANARPGLDFTLQNQESTMVVEEKGWWWCKKPPGYLFWIYLPKLLLLTNSLKYDQHKSHWQVNSGQSSLKKWKPLSMMITSRGISLYIVPIIISAIVAWGFIAKWEGH